MKYKTVFAASALLLALGAQAAQTVEITGFTFNPFSGPINPFNLDNGSHAVTTIQVGAAAPVPPPAGVYKGAGQMSAILNGTDSFLAYCVQINVPVLFSPTVYADYTLVSGVTGFGDRAADLSKLMTWAATAGQPTNELQSAVIQAAVWEIVHESAQGVYSFSGGKLATTSNNTMLNAAITAFDWNTVMNTTPTHVVSRLDGGAQDLLVFAPVPEASTLAMISLGLAGLGFAARKQRRT